MQSEIFKTFTWPDSEQVYMGCPAQVVVSSALKLRKKKSERSRPYVLQYREEQRNDTNCLTEYSLRSLTNQTSWQIIRVLHKLVAQNPSSTCVSALLEIQDFSTVIKQYILERTTTYDTFSQNTTVQFHKEFTTLMACIRNDVTIVIESSAYLIANGNSSQINLASTAMQLTKETNHQLPTIIVKSIEAAINGCLQDFA